MKKLTLTFACAVFLLAHLVSPVFALVSVESTIGDNIRVVYNLENIDPKIYNQTIANTQFNSSTIPQIIVANLEKQNLHDVNYLPQPNLYNNTAKRIRVSFDLGGQDILSFTINRTTMKRIYQVKTEWRKFQVSLTSNFSIPFGIYFAEPVEKWHRINHTDSEGNLHPAYYYKFADAEFLGALSFYFVLPITASNVGVEENTITYEVPPYFEDVFLNSPFLILVALIIMIVIVLVFRRVKK